MSFRFLRIFGICGRHIIAIFSKVPPTHPPRGPSGTDLARPGQGAGQGLWCGCGVAVAGSSGADVLCGSSSALGRIRSEISGLQRSGLWSGADVLRGGLVGARSCVGGELARGLHCIWVHTDTTAGRHGMVTAAQRHEAQALADREGLGSITVVGGEWNGETVRLDIELEDGTRVEQYQTWEEGHCTYLGDFE